MHSLLVTHIGHAESCQKLHCIPMKILKSVPHLLLAAASTSLAASLTTEAAEAAGAAEPPKRLEKEMNNCRNYFKHSNTFVFPPPTLPPPPPPRPDLWRRPAWCRSPSAAGPRCGCPPPPRAAARRRRRIPSFRTRAAWAASRGRSAWRRTGWAWHRSPANTDGKVVTSLITSFRIRGVN